MWSGQAVRLPALPAADGRSVVTRHPAPPATPASGTRQDRFEISVSFLKSPGPQGLHDKPEMYLAQSKQVIVRYLVKMVNQNRSADGGYYEVCDTGKRWGSIAALWSL